MSYRPITDLWFLARARLKGGVKYYGAYLGGFPERARALVGCSLNDPLLHACGGMAKLYPYKRGIGELDETLDLAPETQPDFLQDARDPWPHYTKKSCEENLRTWKGIIVDPPYSLKDSEHYSPGADNYPSPNLLLRRALEVLPVGRRVGIIHYILPSPPKGAVFIACVGVICGFNNRIRVFSVFEKGDEC